MKLARILLIGFLILTTASLAGCKFSGPFYSAVDDEPEEEVTNPCPPYVFMDPGDSAGDVFVLSDRLKSVSEVGGYTRYLSDMSPTGDTTLLGADKKPIPGTFEVEKETGREWVFRPGDPDQLSEAPADASFWLSTAGCMIQVRRRAEITPIAEGQPAQSEQEEVADIPCPEKILFASMADGELTLYESQAGFLTEVEPSSDTKLLDADKNQIPGAFEAAKSVVSDQKMPYWTFTPADVNQLDDGSPKPRTLWMSIGPCMVEVQWVPNPALEPKDAEDDVVQHTDMSQAAENAAPYDDIDATNLWYDGYPLTSETSSLVASDFAGDANPYLAQSLQGAKWEWQYRDTWYSLDNGPLKGERARKYTLGPSPQELEIEKVIDMLLFFSGGNLPTVSGLDKAAPGLAMLTRQSLDAQRDGFQFFAPGSWQAGPLTVTGENFSVQFQGAWSGMAVELATGAWGVWAADGRVEISGGGKTVALQGPGDGENLALSVIAAGGAPGDPQTITPQALGERFGVYTAAMPGWLTFETWLGGPFTPFPPDVDTLAWQILLDFDGDAGTGKTADFYAAQGLGYEVFFHSEGKTVFCGGATAAGEDFSCPTDLFRLAYDPAGRVVMSARIADLQAIAGQAGVEWNPASLRWRFSHINHALEGNPQDVFPNP